MKLVERPQQIPANYVNTNWRVFELLWLFWRFSRFPDLFDKVFLITFKFFQLDFSTIFRKDNVKKNKLFNELVSLLTKEFITVKTVTLCKKLHFFHQKFKKQEKEAATNFVSLSQPRDTIRKFMKTYLHRPIKILQFITPGKV